MPLDPSIIMGGKPADVAGAFTSGMNMANLAKQSQMQNLELSQKQQAFNDDQAQRHAMANNTTVGPDGQVSINRQGVMKDLAQTAPHLVPQLQQTFASQDYNTQKMRLEKDQEQHSYVAQLAAGTHDQASWDAALAKAQSSGIDTSQIPKQFDQNLRDSIISSALSSKDYLANQVSQLEQQNKAAQLKIDSRKLDMDVFKTYGAKVPKNAGGSVDPASLVPQVVPPEKQKDVFQEIKNAQNVGTNGPKILDAFERAANENTIMKTGFGLARTPGSVMQLHQLMLPNFKTIDGTVRQAAMDESFKNVTPQPGDSEAKIKEKREALKSWLTSEAAAPTAKGFGIDLGKYDSTKFSTEVAKSGDEPKTKTASKNSSSHKDLPVGSVSNGYVKTANGWVPQKDSLNASK